MEVDVPGAVATLSAALSSLEAAFEPLAAHNLKDLLTNQEDGHQMDPIEQARTQVLTAYLVHDLIWIYLKTAGVEPETHPVMTELARLKTYFAKLKSAEAPPAARLHIDKDAARRFITGAIGSSRAHSDPFGAAADAGPSGTHTRFDASGGEEEDEAEEAGQGKEEEVPMEVEVVEAEATPAKVKSKRPKMDPFAGYDSPKPAPSATKKAKPAGPGSAAPSPAPKGPAGAAAGGSPALSKHQKKKQQAEKRKAGAKGKAEA